jgi:hypothetical protein
MDRAIGQVPVLDCGTIVAHDVVGPATFGTAIGLVVSVLFGTDRGRVLRTEQRAEADHLMITFFNAEGPTDFNDFTVTFEGRSYHLLIMVISVGVTGNAARQISYTLMDQA